MNHPRLPSRRDHLRLLGGGLAGGAVAATAPGAWSGPALADDSPLPSLRDLAAAKGLKYGSDSDGRLVAAPPEYQALFLHECALYAPNISWGSVSPAQGVYDTRLADEDIDFAVGHVLKLTGAHLIWGRRTPDWATAMQDPERLELAMRDHILTMCTRYAGKVWSWNVVNEAIGFSDVDAADLRLQPFVAKLGDGYIDTAFRAARAANSDSLLLYNDYGFEDDNQASETRRRALLALLDKLVAGGTPIDGVGLQSHLYLERKPFNQALYARFLDEIAAHGVKIVITELDVQDRDAAADIGARDAGVADLYARFLDVALAQRATVGLVTWGLSDRYTWLTPASGPKFGRDDGLPTRPLPFDADFKPKSAFWAVVNALKHAPAR